MLHQRPRQGWQGPARHTPDSPWESWTPCPGAVKEREQPPVTLPYDSQVPAGPGPVFALAPFAWQSLAAPCSHILKAANPPGWEEPGQPPASALHCGCCSHREQGLEQVSGAWGRLALFFSGSCGSPLTSWFLYGWLEA